MRKKRKRRVGPREGVCFQVSPSMTGQGEKKQEKLQTLRRKRRGERRGSRAPSNRKKKATSMRGEESGPKKEGRKRYGEPWL